MRIVIPPIVCTTPKKLKTIAKKMRKCTPIAIVTLSMIVALVSTPAHPLAAHRDNDFEPQIANIDRPSAADKTATATALAEHELALSERRHGQDHPAAAKAL